MARVWYGVLSGVRCFVVFELFWTLWQRDWWHVLFDFSGVRFACGWRGVRGLCAVGALGTLGLVSACGGGGGGGGGGGAPVVEYPRFPPPAQAGDPVLPCIFEKGIVLENGDANCIQQSFASVRLLLTPATITDRTAGLFMVDNASRARDSDGGPTHGIAMQQVANAVRLVNIDTINHPTPSASSGYTFSGIVSPDDDSLATAKFTVGKIRDRYVEITGDRGENALLHVAHAGLFSTDGLTRAELDDGPYILYAAGNFDRTKGTTYRQNAKSLAGDKGVTAAALSSGKVRWIASLDATGKPIDTGCHGVASRCFSVPSVVKVVVSGGGTLNPVPNDGASAATAFAFGVFSMVWERMPPAAVAADVVAIADACTDARLNGVAPTEAEGLGNLRIGCMVGRALDAWGEAGPPAGAPQAGEAFYESVLGALRLPGASALEVDVALGSDLREVFAPARVVAYVPEARVPAHILPLFGPLSVSARENREVGLRLELPASALSLTRRKAPDFFGGYGTRAFALGDATHDRIRFEWRAARVLTLEAWKTFGEAEGRGRLLESVKGEEEGFAFKAEFGFSRGAMFSVGGQAARFKRGKVRLAGGETFDVRSSKFERGLNLAWRTKF